MKRHRALTFTKHAFSRVVERLRLTPREVAVIIENNKYIPIGQEKNKVHKAFYSIPDKQCFIAVHDEHKNEVVTILPPDFHHRWVVSEDTFYAVKELMLGRAGCQKVDELPELAAADSVQTKSETPKSPTSKETGQSLVTVNFTCYFREFGIKKLKIIRFKVQFVALTVWQYYLRKFNQGDSASRRELLKELAIGLVQSETWQKDDLHSVFYQIGKKGECSMLPL